jgi:glycine/serine hydroxymethyltransferase
MRVISRCIARVLGDYKDKSVLEKTRQEILELVSGFPLYPDFDVLE